MGIKVAIASGSWSNTAIWNSGTLPIAGDVVAANGYTVLIDQNVDVNSITNTAQTAQSAVPVMTSDTTPSGTSSASSTTSPRAAYQAFDGNSAGTWWTSGTGLPQWLSYEFSAAKIITKYKFLSHTYVLRDWTFEGWDGANWVILDTVTSNAVATYTSVELGNTTPYIKYRINVTALVSGNTVNFYELLFYEKGYTVDAIAGGTFNMGGGVTVTCTGNIAGGATTVLTWTGAAGTTSTLNAGILYGASVASVNNIVLSGAGTLNINVLQITGAVTNVTSRTLYISGTGTINIVGLVANGPGTSAYVIYIASTCTINLTGNVYHNGGSGLRMIYIAAACILNIVGDITAYYDAVLQIAAAASVTVTGTVQSVSILSPGNAITTATNSYLKVVGPVISTGTYSAIVSTSTSAINILTGPFVHSSYGFSPMYLTRMHLQPILNNYIQFRDSSTDGAVSPGPTASIANLVSADTVISDQPIPANVRAGVSYGSGAYIGTMVVPNPANVRLSIPVDNTTGSAVLAVEDIWNYNINSLTGSNSIGDRLRTVSTVGTTGAQIAGFRI